MKIECVNLGIIDENCYLISTEGAAVVIDPGYYSNKISDFLNQNIEKQRLILITHSHFDHIGGVKRISEETNTKIAIGKFDALGLKDPQLNLSSSFGMPVTSFDADILLENNEIIDIGDIRIKTLHTPGHTKGSVCYLIDNYLFSGDTLFFESFGRTDFPGGNSEYIKESFYTLISSLNDDIIVYPGHGAKTTIGYEKENNPLVYMSVL